MEAAMRDGAKRVRKHRDKMKAAGLKPVTIWVPDINAPGYREEIRRQCELINASADSAIVLEGMLAIADFSDWQA
jgi:hypothetical protein